VNGNDAAFRSMRTISGSQQRLSALGATLVSDDSDFQLIQDSISSGPEFGFADATFREASPSDSRTADFSGAGLHFHQGRLGPASPRSWLCTSGA